MQALTISVAEILGRPGTYRDLVVSEPITGIRTALARVGEAPVRGELRLESVVEGVLLTGTVEAPVAARCARCLKDLDTRVAPELCELFVAPGHEAPADEDVYEVRGTEIDIEPALRDALTLSLPLNPLCLKDCKGLCATCGIDLNSGACECVEEDVDPRWAGLEALRTKLER